MMVNFKSVFFQSFAIGINTLIFGLVFGIIAENAGLNMSSTILMSAIVYAGTAQLAMVSLLDNEVGLIAIILSVFLINSRHLIMGLSLSPYFKNERTNFIYTYAFLMVDAIYALTLDHIKREKVNKLYLLMLGTFIYIYWLLGTVIGIWLADSLPPILETGLNFSFVALFIALGYTCFSTLSKGSIFIFCGAVSVVGSLFLFEGVPILISGLLAFSIGYFINPSMEEV